MKLKIIYLAILIFGSHYIFGQELKKESQKKIANFIECIKNDRKNEVAEMFSYPFERQYPIPEIKNKQEFIKRYDEIFDTKLKSLIIKSKPSKDWSEVGWRGIMLYNGDLWMDTDGRLTAVNYQSKAESTMRNKIMESEKKTLHPSIANYKNPYYILETDKFRIRIDEISPDNYRYCSWDVKKGISEKPDLIINNGAWIPDGSGGNSYFKFKNGDYTYECYIIVMGESGSPPALFTIYKGDKEVLSQKVKKLKG
jgi:hypothetical protein